MTRFLIILMLCLAAWRAAAQDIKVLSISDGNYPEIQVSARIIAAQGDSVVVTERGERVPCRVDEGLSLSNRDGRMYVFLVENSFSFFHNDVFPFIKKTLLNIDGNFGKADNVNILHYGTPGRTVKYLSAGQTNDYALMRYMVEDNFCPQTDSSYFDNNLVMAIQEALDYSKQHQKPQETVVLTIVCRGLNLSNVKDFEPGFREKLQKSGVYLNILMYDSEAQNARRDLEELAQVSGGNFVTFREESLEKTLVQSLEKMSKTKSKSLFSEIMITFNATQNGVRNSFVVNYGKTEARCEYTNPGKTGFLGKYPIAVSIMIGLMVVLAAIIFYIRTKTKIIRRIDNATQSQFHDLQRQNRILKQEIEKYKKHPLSLAHSFDNIYIEETLIGSGKIIPKLQIEDHGKHEVFKITKLSITIGRNENNDIVLDNRTVSGRHATLTNEGGLFYITDNDSTNGIFVNDIRITKSKIQAKDRIRIGSVMATLVY